MRVPYSPFFLQQITAGHVTSITSKGTAIQGTFTRAESYAKSKPTKLFATEIPAFADTKALSQLLESKSVVVNAKPLTSGLPWWESLLVGFGPTILFVGLLFWLYEHTAPPIARKHPGQRGQEHPIGWTATRPGHLPPKHREFMTQNEYLDLVRGR